MQCVYNRMTTMSKLKRKKLSVEESRSEQHSRIKKSNDSLCTVQDSSCSKTSTGRERWWESSELNDVERLWALTLRALCPALQSDQEEPIPQLPPPSSTKTPVQKVSDWRWCNADEDTNPPPDLPAPSFLTHPQPVNDCKNPSQPPAAENMGESDPPPLADQENYISSPDQESVSVCDIQTAQQHHLEVYGVEGRKLSDKQGDKSQVSEMQELTIGSETGLDPESRAGGSGAGLDVGSSARASGAGLDVGSSARASGAGLDAESRAGGSGAGLDVGSSARASGAGLDAESRAGGSGAGLNAGSRAGGSGTGKGIKTGAGGSGSGLGTIPGTEGSVSGMGIKQKAGVSGSGQRAKPGPGGSGTGQRANSGVRGSGLGLGTKSGAGQGAKSGLEGSGSGLERNSEAGGSGLGQGTKSGPEGSGAVSGSGLECCPMCLMPFPEG
ncbi:hypothetical protein DPX16_7787 [Anabarilius grahami]|uniref:Uncharacterized protein n=1 Tax=Anabarilius grahami TaxID=495550 RepID=A0A3N0XJI3_ANAGA|nr:hypothetical protein DPX16_7787 [Anabarilius grahami]